MRCESVIFFRYFVVGVDKDNWQRREALAGDVREWAHSTTPEIHGCGLHWARHRSGPTPNGLTAPPPFFFFVLSDFF